MKNIRVYLDLSIALWIASISLPCAAQVTFRIVQLPASTPPDAEIYLSGNFEGWTGGQEAYRLEKNPDSLYEITLPQMAGAIQFKFTRGSWGMVEKGPNGEEIANRNYTFGGNGAVVDVTVHNWADLSTISSTATANVYLLDAAFNMPQLGRTRKLWIYLPPGYDTSQMTYPVLYMHDGQNIFDDSTAFAGEWEVDESLNTLFDETGFGLIVVGIENGGSVRIDEYSPWVHPQYGGGEGESYVAFISETLKPHIDSTFRVSPEPGLTGIMGSSMGGLISHYAGLAEPGVFGRAGVFSPSFALFDSCYAFTSGADISPESKFYFAAGGLEGGVVNATQAMVDLMLSLGTPDDRVQMIVDPQGQHNEAFWRREFRAAIEWLYADALTNTTGTEYRMKSIGVFPNPASGVIHFPTTLSGQESILELFDITGYKVISRGGLLPPEMDVSHLTSGIYISRIYLGGKVYLDKVVIR